MGLAKVLLGGRSKESGLAKCARVDSLGLTRRRLASKVAKTEEEPAGYASEPEGRRERTSGGSVAARKAALPNGVEPQMPTDQGDDAVPFGTRQVTDSLRLNRRRLQQRTSFELHQQCSLGHGAQRSAWSNSASPGLVDVRAGQPVPPHVRLRRASDGEYLSRLESSIPSAFRAVQQKAEWLFRRLTGVPEPAMRERSATHARGASPHASQRGSGRHARDSAAPAWAHAVRRRRTSDGGSGDESPPRAAASGSAANAAGRERRKRQSAPGELFSGGDADDDFGADGDGGSPPLSVAGARRPASAIFKDASGHKSRNWLARLSRGLNNASVHMPPHPRPQPSVSAVQSPTAASPVAHATAAAAATAGSAAAPPPPLQVASSDVVGPPTAAAPAVAQSLGHARRVLPPLAAHPMPAGAGEDWWRSRAFDGRRRERASPQGRAGSGTAATHHEVAVAVAVGSPGTHAAAAGGGVLGS